MKVTMNEKYGVMVSKYNEVDCSDIDKLIAQGGKYVVTSDWLGNCARRGRYHAGQEVRMPDGTKFDTAAFDDDILECECGGTYQMVDGALVCDKCGALHPDCE